MTVNKLHTFGYERIMFVKGEEYLMLVKTTEEEDAEPDDPQAVRHSNLTTGCMRLGTRRAFAMDGRRVSTLREVSMNGCATGTIKVPLMERTVHHGVSLPLFALKTSRERDRRQRPGAR